MEAEFEDWKPWVTIGLVSIIYIGFIISSIMEPLSNLKKMTKAELEDHEYERIIVDDFSESFDSITKHNSAWKNDDVETNGPSRRRKEEIELQSKDD